MYKVRFHLSKGANYMKWQITGDVKSPDKLGKSEPFYVDPDEVCLYMLNSKLVNHTATAEKINCGANKSVCAWIECENLMIHRYDNDLGKAACDYICEKIANSNPELFYNPRKVPYWCGHNGTNMDGESNLTIFTAKRRLFHYSRSIQLQSL
jgi:hypothetical protein